MIALAVVLGVVFCVSLLWHVARDTGESSRETDLSARNPPAARPTSVANVTSVVVLEDNRWDECSFDGVQEDWQRRARDDVRGFVGVPPGRHQASTRTACGQAVLDFVLYPGEVYVRRLNAESRRWTRVVHGPAIPASLVTYPMRLSAPRTERSAARDATVRLGALLERACAGQAPDPLLREARGLGHALIGVPLTRTELRALTATLERKLDAPLHAAYAGRAVLLVRIALSVLPEDPYLLERFAAMLHADGRSGDALDAVDRALERDSALDADALRRARTTRALILAALDRTSEARVLIDAVVRENPSETYAASVRHTIYARVAN